MLDSTKPYWFLDIDGVINAYSYFTGYSPDNWQDFTSVVINGYTIVYSPSLIRFINEISEEVNILWLTTWRENANFLFAPDVNLRTTFPVADLLVVSDLHPDALLPKTQFYSDRSGWHKFAILKTLVERFGPDARFIWTDDDITHLYSDLVSSQFGDRSLVIAPKPSEGLTPEHVDMISRFIKQ